jgi:bleomycin hydrolase
MKQIAGVIDIEKIRTAYTTHEESPLTDVMRSAIIANGIEVVALNHTSRIRLQNNFSDELKTGKITSQEKSGRCWMFAGLNLFRTAIANKLQVDDFEFSQNFPMFYDKLEKANFFLESVLRTINEEIYSRIVMWILYDPLLDGGQWDMFVNLISKYGAVPKSVMPETFHSSNSALMNQLLTSQLRQWAAELRDLYRQDAKIELLRSKKEEYLLEFYRILTYFLGTPPLQFNYEYRDKDGNFHTIENITPPDFYRKYVGIDLNDYISLIHAPTPDKPFGKTYTIDFLGNIVEGRIVKYLNTRLEELKKATISQLKDGLAVWFGCDIRFQTERKKGLMDPRIYLFDHSLGTTFKLDKSARLLYGDSLLTHAMVFTGVNISNNEPNRWKVENSWGEDRGEKGFFIMSDQWFDEYVYQVVIHKDYLAAELLEQYNQEPVVLPPWDPIGALAIKSII